MKYERTNRRFSLFGGLAIFKNLIEQTRLGRLTANHLPKDSVFDGGKSKAKFTNLLLGFAAGAQCLEDLDGLAQDPLYEELCDIKAYCSKSYGDYLRSFRPNNVRVLNEILGKFSFSLRKTLFPDQEEITFDLDSTTNQQYGLKMQGVRKNHEGILCLDTIMAYDEYGFQYWHEVRAGATYSSNSSELIVHELANIAKDKKITFRADSAFCKESFFEACEAKGAKYVVKMKDNIFMPYESRIKNWQPAPDKVKRLYDGRECEVAVYTHPNGSEKKPQRIIVLRAQKLEKDETALFQDHVEYDYYAFVTNTFRHEMTEEEVILFYRKRGNAENFIKELKHGFDLKHYPCLSLEANKAYGLIGAFSYTLMRFMGLTIKPERPLFAKAIRKKFIYLPCQLVRSGREVCVRLMQHHLEEIRRWYELIANIQFGFV